MTETTLSVVTWNILANSSLVPNWYPSVNIRELTPGRRSHSVAEVIDRLPGDIIALQEVEPLVKKTLSHSHPEDSIYWCPKGRDFDEGLLTIVRPSEWNVVNEYRFAYRVAAHLGQVAQILDLEHANGTCVRVINTHLRWEPLGTPATERIGRLHAKELLHRWVEDAGPVVLAADLNDPPEGPIREVLMTAGFAGLTQTWTTAYYSGMNPESIDAIAVVGGAEIISASRPIVAEPPLPTLDFPSDHLPIETTIAVLNPPPQPAY